MKQKEYLKNDKRCLTISRKNGITQKEKRKFKNYIAQLKYKNKQQNSKNKIK